MQPSEIMAHSRLIYTADNVDLAVKKLASRLNETISDTNPVVICVMNGGLVFAGQLLTQLTFPLETDYVHATRYQNGTSGKKLVWKVLPQLDLTNRTVLLVDDILDVGITLSEIVDKCIKLGAKVVYSVVLIEKEINTQKAIKADFVGFNVPDAYVFGFGMDAFGWWRNLPAIYVFKE